MFNKSIATVRDLPSGTILAPDMLTEKKPGTGIPAADLPTLIGRVLARDVSSANLLVPDDLDSSVEPEIG
jgi:sialic acid synthase SpsE